MRTPSLVIALGAATLAAGGPLARAQDAPDRGPDINISGLAPGARIDAARARLRDESLSGADRLAALRSLIDALDARLRMADIPPETRARDAVELAESSLTASAWEGVQATASVGVLTPGMRDAARASAERALDAAQTFERAGAARADDTLRARAVLARARAGALLRAASSDDASRARGLEALASIRSAASLLRAREGEALGGEVVENAEAEAQRLTLLGLLALEEGRADEARRRFTDAAAIALSPRTKAEATLAGAFATRAIDGPRAAYDRLGALERDADFGAIERDDPLVRILRADAMRRVAIASAEFATGDDLSRAVRDAGAPYMALAERGVPGIEPLALRALLWEKAASSAAPLLARLGPTNASVNAAFERAAAGDRAALSSIVASDDALGALGPFAPDALWRAASALRENTDDAAAQRDAATLLLRLASTAPDDPRAGAALGGAASCAQRAAALANESPESLDLYERTLRAALARAERAKDPALRADSLRFELGRVLALEGRDDDASGQLAGVTSGDLGLRAAELLLSLAQRAGDEARVARAADVVRSRSSAILAQGENDAARRALERAGAVGQNAALRVAVERSDADAAGKAAVALVDSGAAGADRTLRDEAVNLVERLAAVERDRGELNDAQRRSARVAAAIGAALVDASSRAKSAALDGDRVLLARAQRMTGDAKSARDAAAALEDVMSRAGRAPELLAELGEALHAAGDDQRAFGVYRELANATRPDDARTGTLHWLAWGRMLQILAANNDDGSRSATIKAQAERLRLIDPGLGGSPHRERIEGAAKSAR